MSKEIMAECIRDAYWSLHQELPIHQGVEDNLPVATIAAALYQERMLAEKVLPVYVKVEERQS